MFYDRSPEAYQQSTYINKLQGLIREAMKDERHDRVKYNNMMGMTDNKEIIDQIKYAYDDEGKHYRMFQNIYEDLTGKEIDIPVPEVEGYHQLVDAVKTSINGELGAVELYREIRSMLQSKRHRDMMYEIITDEQEHGSRFIYIYAMLK
jgi:rubrerythrin